MSGPAGGSARAHSTPGGAPRPPMGGPGGRGHGPMRGGMGMAMPTEKPKDFRGTFRRLIGDSETLVLGRLAGADAVKALVIVAVMTVHSASEGVGVGVSYGGGERLGILITIAIAVHNIPEGLAISLVLVPRGASVRAAAWWSIFSSLPQPLIAPLAFLFVEQFNAVLPAGLGFAAGAMIWMVFSELLPEALRDAPKRSLALAGGFSFAVMLGAQLALFGV